MSKKTTAYSLEKANLSSVHRLHTELHGDRSYVRTTLSRKIKKSPADLMQILLTNRDGSKVQLKDVNEVANRNYRSFKELEKDLYNGSVDVSKKSSEALKRQSEEKQIEDCCPGECCPEKYAQCCPEKLEEKETCCQVKTSCDETCSQEECKKGRCPEERDDLQHIMTVTVTETRTVKDLNEIVSNDLDGYNGYSCGSNDSCGATSSCKSGLCPIKCFFVRNRGAILALILVVLVLILANHIMG